MHDLSDFRILCVHGCLCAEEWDKVETSGSLCVSSWLTGPAMMTSSTWLVSTPIAVKVVLMFFSAVSQQPCSWRPICFCVAPGKRVKKRTYITISSDSDDEPVRFVPSAPVVVRDDDEEDEVSILEVTGSHWPLLNTVAPVLTFLFVCQSQPLPHRELIRPAAKWGANAAPTQASGSDGHPATAHSHQPSVATAHSTLGNQAIGVLTTDPNSVPSTSRGNALHRPPLPVRNSLPPPTDSSSGASSALAPLTPESGHTDSAHRIEVVIRRRAEKHAERPPTPQGAPLVEIKTEKEQRVPVVTVTPARFLAPTDNERPGPSVPREPPVVYQAPEQTSLETLVKGVVSLLVCTSQVTVSACSHCTLKPEFVFVSPHISRWTFSQMCRKHM